MAERIRNSFGKCHINKGEVLKFDETKPYELDYSRQFYLFDIIPMGAVRMTKSDTWKTNPNHPDPAKRQRKVVQEYFNFKNSLLWQAKSLQFELKTHLDVLFLIPMPNTWSKKKKEQMNGLPHKQKPDTDNLTKSVKDALKKDDSDVWWEKAEKRWAYKGSIIIFS
jgi:Holliday junction resolvase RusA-like endonuclease